ncbi:MAG: hypothetical protein KIC78_06555 [Prevotella sp.]|uniref:hypothetical protein n=1 Tax=Prevotella sp. TaxID=59823 RepID=UPI00257E9DE7|nr:hypothetical protein [Prevotella sp.]MBS5875819.1 hypothetical protein [Prevotella sp.]
MGRARVFKEKILPAGLEIFLKTIEHPNPGFTFAPRTGTIHLMRLSERPSKMEVNGCGGILDMKCSEKRKKGNVKKEGIRRKRETGKHHKKVCCNRVAKPV